MNQMNQGERPLRLGRRRLTLNTSELRGASRALQRGLSLNDIRPAGDSTPHPLLSGQTSESDDESHYQIESKNDHNVQGSISNETYALDECDEFSNGYQKWTMEIQDQLNQNLYVNIKDISTDFGLLGMLIYSRLFKIHEICTSRKLSAEEKIKAQA